MCNLGFDITKNSRANTRTSEAYKQDVYCETTYDAADDDGDDDDDDGNDGNDGDDDDDCDVNGDHSKYSTLTNPLSKNSCRAHIRGISCITSSFRASHKLHRRTTSLIFFYLQHIKHLQI